MSGAPDSEYGFSKNPVCPNCGNGFAWDARFSQLIICDACDSAIVIDKDAAKIAGKMSALADTPGPLFVGATGTVKVHGKKKRFHVLGRVRYGYDAGFWDEWYLTESDGRSFWIGEDELEFTLTRLTEKRMPDSFWQRAQPGRRLSYGEHSYLVQERGTATCEAGEGQLPFVVLPGKKHGFVELVAPGGQFVTVEKSLTEEGQPGADRVFQGTHVSLQDFDLDLVRSGDSNDSLSGAPSEGRERVRVKDGQETSLSCFACGGALDVKSASARDQDRGALTCPYCSTINDLANKKLQCPSCGESVALPGGDAVDFLVCPCCQAEVDTSGAEPAVLGQSAAVVTGGSGCFKVGQRCRFDGQTHVITGMLTLKTDDSWGVYFSSEYLLFSPKLGYRWLTEEDGHFNLLEQLKDPPTAMSAFGRAKTKWDGVTWTHFESDDETIHFVNGQLPYVARQGDKHQYTDWVAAPQKLTSETTATEREYFLGSYLSTAEVAEAFGVDKSSLPQPDGVGSNQPYTLSAWRRALKPFLLLFMLANLALVGYSNVSGKTRAVVDVGMAELKQDVTSEPVKFKAKLIEADFRFHPQQGVRRGYATVTVIDDTGRAVQDFSAQWKKNTQVVFRLRRAGLYTLKINADVSPAVGVRVTFKEGVLLSRYHLILGLGMFMWLLLEWISRRSFESRRFSDANDDAGYDDADDYDYDDDDD